MACRHRSLLLASLALAIRQRWRRQKEKRKQKRRFWVPKIFSEERKERGEWENLFYELSEDDREYYYKYLRMSPERFEHLFNLVAPFITKQDTNYRNCIPARKRLVITLRYLVEGCSQQALSLSFRVGKSTVLTILREVCDALYNVLSPIYLRPSSTEEEWEQISSEFLDLWNMPHVVGAIDGKHVAMECPKNSGSLYHNFKGFFSQVLLAVCDAKYKFTSIDVGQYGSTNDSPVLKNSELRKRLELYSLNISTEEIVDENYLKNGEPFVLPYYMVGDEIFQLKDYLMRPYPGTKSGKLPVDQAVFNYRLSRARRVIENCFGILVARWRLFRRPIRADTENVTSYILAAVALHNYLQQTENAYPLESE